jgi:hypothetical protein
MKQFMPSLVGLGIRKSITDFGGMLSELKRWNGGIITVPEGAAYRLQENRHFNE